MIWAGLQRLMAAGGLLLLSPFLGMLALAVRLTSRGGAIHRATRISRGRPFFLLKFRTMHAVEAGGGIGVTVAGDLRVTALGRLLRKTKVDELPQLWNVVRGDMLLVGPRPEDPRYVSWSDPVHQLVFNARPGITGPAAIAFRNEEVVLADETAQLSRELAVPISSDLVERAYVSRILPRKLAMDAEYLRTRSVGQDVRLLVLTIFRVLRPSS